MRALIIAIIVLVAIAIWATVCVGTSIERQDEPRPSKDKLDELKEGVLGRFQVPFDDLRIRASCELSNLAPGQSCVVCLLPAGWLPQTAKLSSTPAGAKVETPPEISFEELKLGANPPVAECLDELDEDEVTRISCDAPCPDAKNNICCRTGLKTEPATLQVPSDGGAFSVTCNGPESCTVTLTP